MFNRKLKFLFLSLICLLSFSCSFSLMDSGNISFNLPDNRAAGGNDVINYRITVQDMNGHIFYDKYSTNTEVRINNLPRGRYYIAIKGHDSTYNYFGDQHFTIEPGKRVSINVQLTKTKIDIGNEDKPLPKPPVPLEKTLTSIDVTLKNNEFVLYKEIIDIKKFNIVEHYSNGDVIAVTDYSKYSISPNIIQKPGNTKVTITHNPTNIKNDSSIPCKFNFTNKLTVSLTPKDSIVLEQGKNHNTVINANLTFAPPMPENSYNVTYEWLEKTAQNTYTVINDQNTMTFKPSVAKAGEKTYKCKVTVTVKDEFKNFCIKDPHEKDYTLTASAEKTITVKEAGSTNAGDGNSNEEVGGDTSVKTGVKSSTELEEAVKKAKTGDEIALGGSFEIDREILIDKNIKITAKEPVTLTRKSDYKGIMFNVKKYQSAILTLGSETSARITIDGNNVTDSETMINVPESTQLHMTNCTLQNNKEKNAGGGAINNTQGTIIINNSLIQNNLSKKDGGGISVVNGRATLTNVTISNNTTFGKGGGISITNNSSNVTINGTSSITENKAPQQGTGYGGGMYIGGGEVILKDSASINKNNANAFGKNLYIDQNSAGIKFNNKRISTVKYTDNAVTSGTDMSK